MLNCPKLLFVQGQVPVPMTHAKSHQVEIKRILHVFKDTTYNDTTKYKVCQIGDDYWFDAAKIIRKNETAKLSAGSQSVRHFVSWCPNDYL